MTPANAFRAAYPSAREAGFSGTRRAFADLVLATGTPRQQAQAAAWTREHPEPEATTQRRHGRTHAADWQGWQREREGRLRVVREEPADRLLQHLGLDEPTKGERT